MAPLADPFAVARVPRRVSAPPSSRFMTVHLGGYRSRRGGDLRREATTGSDSRLFFPESDPALESVAVALATQGWLGPKVDPRRLGVSTGRWRPPGVPFPEPKEWDPASVREVNLDALSLGLGLLNNDF
jgi:hypothetical protein